MEGETSYEEGARKQYNSGICLIMCQRKIKTCIGGCNGSFGSHMTAKEKWLYMRRNDNGHEG